MKIHRSKLIIAWSSILGADLRADQRRPLGRGPDVLQYALRRHDRVQLLRAARQLLDTTGINWGFSDTLCLLGLFCVSLVVLRLTTETLAPAMVRFPMPIYHAGRLLFGLAGRLRHHGDRDPGVPAAPRSTRRSSRLRLRQQAAVRSGAGPPVAGVLPVRDRRGLRPVQRGQPGSVPTTYGQGATVQALRSPRRMADQSPERPALRDRDRPATEEAPRRGRGGRQSRAPGGRAGRDRP